jgi:hypothetical protein
MEGWQVALLVLAAVFVGALLPLLAQLYGTLRTLRSVMDKMRGTMQIAGNVSAAVVPAVIAAVRAWKGEMSEDPSRAASAEPAAPESSTQQRKEASG